MIVRDYTPSIDYSACRLCRKCEEICPAAAINFLKEEKKMDVDERRCIDCQRCMDACLESAISMVLRTRNRSLAVEISELDQERIASICRKVGLAPGEAVCGCTFVTAREMAGAILKGARTPEDVCAMTGIRRGCGIYCLVNVFKILDGGGIQPEERAKSHLYHHPLSPLDIPRDRLRELDTEFPQYRLLEDVSLIRECRGIQDDQGV